MNLNPEQKRAVDTLDRPVCLIAGAGTGKTKVLTSRYLKLLESRTLPKGKEVSSILAITFTEKAAGEMKQRISGILREKGKDDEYFSGLAEDFLYAPVSTIHGFCAEVIGEFSPDSGFRILEEDELWKEKLRIMEKLLKEQKDPEKIWEFIGKIRKKSRIKDGAAELLQIYENARNRHLSLRPGKIPGKPSMDEWIRVWEKTLAFSQNLSNRTKLKKFVQSPRFDEIKNTDMAQGVEEILSHISASLAKGEGASLVSELEGLMEYEDQKFIPYLQEILRVLEDFELRFEEWKEKKGVKDYEDLVLDTVKLLENEEILQVMKNRFLYIMIDECQDTDPLQSYLFRRLSEGKDQQPFQGANLFIVGDPKQSIYGFRGADLSSFYTLMEDMEKAGGEIIRLKTNYRSGENILQWVNKEFSQVITPYDPLEGFRKGHGEVSLLLHDGHEHEAIGKEIIRRHQEGIPFEHMAVLFRAREPMKAMGECLRQLNIPVVIHGEQNFLDHRLGKDLYLLLRSFSTPDDSVVLTGVYRSPFVGMSLSGIRNLFLQQLPEGEDLQRFSAWEKKREEMCEYLTEDPGTFLLKLYEVFNVEQVYSSYDPSLDLFPMELFLVSAGEAADQGEDFDAWMDRLERTQSRGIPFSGGKASGVSLMTIHGAKGLEFPVVFLAGADRTTGLHHQFFEIGEDGSLGVSFGDWDIQYGKYRQQRRKREQEEERRLEYVACTRAEDTLILCSGEKPGKESMVGRMHGEIQCLSSPEGNLEEWVRPVIEKRKEKKEKKVFSDPGKGEKPITGVTGLIHGEATLPLHGEPEKEESERDNNAITVGMIFHKLMEIPRESREKKALERYFHFPISQPLWSNLEEWVAFAEDLGDPEARIYREFPLRFSHEGKIIQGFADEVREYDDHTEVWDYKTGYPGKELRKKYFRQLELYAKGLEKVFGKPCTLGKLVYPGAKKVEALHFPVDPE